MIIDETVTLQSATITRNGEGMKISTFADGATLQCNIQPKALTEAQAKVFGISDKNANAKVMYYYHNAAVVEMMRVKRSDGSVFDVRGINHWRIHDEAILIPLQGV